jgi:hypothetical protein
MNRLRAALLAVVLAPAGGGCPVASVTDGIGQPCTVDEAPCPADHFCQFEAPTAEDPGPGVCAPVIDYGACPPPTWPIRVDRVVDGDRTVSDVGGLLDLDGVRRVAGELVLEPSGPVGALAVGDLCPLAGLQHVDRLLVVRNLDVTTLDGLQAVGFAGGIAVIDNADLEDVAALQNLQLAVPPDVTTVGVFIANNRALDPALVDALAATLGARGVTVTGCGNRGQIDCDPSFATLLALVRQR